MNRTRLSLLFGGLLLLFAILIGVVVYNWTASAPTDLSGDAWDYALRLNDLPEGWTLADHSIITRHDLEQEKLEASAALTASVTATPTLGTRAMTQSYYARFRPPDTSGYAELTCQVLLYETDTEAQTALASENPGAEWESVAAPAVADGASLWHFLTDSSVNENIYRLDFRYRNGIASVTLFGTAQAVPNSDETVSYANKILERMKAGTLPADLKSLQAAGKLDVRKLLLTQDQLTQADSVLGGRWQYAVEPLPAWTPTSLMSAGAQQALAPLGRVNGYQMFFYKSVTADEYHSTLPLLLFQQITAYQRADNAQKGLDMMKGIEQVEEFPNPPQIGDGQTHAWRGELTSGEGENKFTVAVSEIDFRVGSYVASIKIQSRPLDQSELTTANMETKKATAGKGLIAVSELVESLAKLMAENIQKGTK